MLQDVFTIVLQYNRLLPYNRLVLLGPVSVGDKSLHMTVFFDSYNRSQVYVNFFQSTRATQYNIIRYVGGLRNSVQ